VPILDTPIDLQHRLIVPAVIAGLSGEMIPIFPMASRPDHHIDARAAAQGLPHSHGNGTSFQSWIWLGSEGPVVFATAKGGPRRCILDARDIIATAGFKQENVDIGVLCQSPRHQRSRAADDEVVVRLQLGTPLLLIGTDARGEVIGHDAPFYRVGVDVNLRFG
jgi:hypothetical protein